MRTGPLEYGPREWGVFLGVTPQESVRAQRLYRERATV